MERVEGLFTTEESCRITRLDFYMGVLFGNVTKGTIARGMKARLTAHGYTDDVCILGVEEVLTTDRRPLMGLSFAFFAIEDLARFLALDWAGKEVEVYTE